ncbi:MAG: hypothetical protein V2J02_01580 [Pseudomonadales bacterium]|jgi:hypothetical protein|nr:hypothetical protein [Pseudomonadales bacterium]
MALDSDDDDFEMMLDEEEEMEDLDEDGPSSEVGSDEEEGEVLVRPASPSRLLAVRRAIEQRMEQKRLAADLDYLDLDFEDEE